MIQIRTATLADVPGIARVHVDTWRTTYKGIVPDEHLAKLSYERREGMWRDVVQRAAAREHLVVAVEEADVVGFSNGGINRATEFPFDGELFAIYLRSQHQGTGVGRQLFRETVTRLAADGFRSMMLWVLADNPTCRFYERMGGRVCGDKVEEIGTKALKELAYGWRELTLMESV